MTNEQMTIRNAVILSGSRRRGRSRRTRDDVQGFATESLGFARDDRRQNLRHNMIVSPRAGPTLTMESFAPASSEMNLTYFLAAEGSCENLRAVCMDVFQPATSS